MKTRWRHGRTILACAALGLALAACSRGPHAGAISTSPPGATGLPTSSSTGPGPHSPTSQPVPSQAPVPPESNPPGDIPDTTVFVPYHSATGGFTIRVPEGWARSTSGRSVSFVDKLNSITVQWIRGASPPTLASARSVDVPELRTTELAFRLKSISGTTLRGQPAVLIVYESNSKPNPVTGKQYRLVVERFELFHRGEEAILSLSSPVGADNVDPWRTVSESFSWS